MHIMILCWKTDIDIMIVFLCWQKLFTFVENSNTSMHKIIYIWDNKNYQHISLISYQVLDISFPVLERLEIGFSLSVDLEYTIALY